MSLRVVIVSLAILALTVLSYGQAARQSQAPLADYSAQLQAASSDVAARIQALEAQAASSQPAEQESIQRQIAETKRQGEIQRLKILLEWAQSTGDQARTGEIEQALNNWRNPPQPTNLPQLPKGSERADNSIKPEASGPVTNPGSSK
jgi:hypothetical protein